MQTARDDPIIPKIIIFCKKVRKTVKSGKLENNLILNN